MPASIEASSCARLSAPSPYRIVAEKVGFEPTVPCGITGFQDRLLKPLGHLSEFADESLIIITHKAEVVNPFLCRKGYGTSSFKQKYPSV